MSASKIRSVFGATILEKQQTAKKGVDGLPTEDLVSFARLYAHSAGNMLDAVVNLDFSAIASVWKSFWRTDENSESRVSYLILMKHCLCLDITVFFLNLSCHI